MNAIGNYISKKKYEINQYVVCQEIITKYIHIILQNIYMLNYSVILFVYIL